MWIPLVVDGRPTAQLEGKPLHQYARWIGTGKIPKDALRTNTEYDTPYRLEELANREIVWHMTQELSVAAGWRDRWDALGETKVRQREIADWMMTHPELIVELLALRK